MTNPKSDRRYNPDKMPDSEATTPPEVTCKCGYFLAGLPKTAGTRCPGCGELLRPLIIEDPPVKHGWLYVLVALSPALVSFSFIAIAAFDGSEQARAQTLNTASWVFTVMLYLIGIPASFQLGRAVVGFKEKGAQLTVGFVSMLLCWMVNKSAFHITHSVIVDLLP